MSEFEEASEEVGEEVLEDEVREEQPRRYKVKVDDAEEEIDEEELLKGYQKAKASDKRFQEAAKYRKEAEQIFDLVNQLKTNPDLLEQLGIDLDSYSEKRLLKKLEQSLKSPEEIELEEYRSSKQKQEAAKKQQQEEAELEQISQEIDQEIFESLQASGLKPTPRLIARLAEQMLSSLDDKGNRIKGSDALMRVKKDYAADVSELVESMSPEQLSQAFPELVKKLRSHSIAQSQSPQVPSFKAGATPKQSQEEKPKRRSIDDILGK